MAKNRTSSQEKSARRVYAYLPLCLLRADVLSVKFFILGGQTIAVDFKRRHIADYVSQIDAALSDGEEILIVEGERYVMSASLLLALRAEFFCAMNGGNGSHLAEGVSLAQNKEPARLPFGAREFTTENNGRVDRAKSSACELRAGGGSLNHTHKPNGSGNNAARHCAESGAVSQFHARLLAK